MQAPLNDVLHRPAGPGTSQVKGNATLVGFGEQSRMAKVDGYKQAVDQLIPQLQAQLDGFRDRIKNDANFKVENKAGYSGGGSFGWLGVLMALALAVLGYGKRRAAWPNGKLGRTGLAFAWRSVRRSFQRGCC